MNIFYEGGQIVGVKISEPRIDSRLTGQEKLDIFGCAQPDADVWAAAVALEKGQETNLAVIADLMVAKSLISAQRGNEIKA